MNDTMNRQILYFDMDNVLVDFESGLRHVPEEVKTQYEDDGSKAHKPHYDDIPGIFALMEPVEGAVEAVKRLSEHYDCYILSTSPWGNPTALDDKLAWVKWHFDNTVAVETVGDGETNGGNPFYKKVIFSHHKNLCLQEDSWLIDDRDRHGASAFGDRHIHFRKVYPDWDSVLKKLIKN